MFVSTAGGPSEQFVTAHNRGDVYSNEEILLQRHKSSGQREMEVTWSRNRATMCFLRPFVPPDPHITIACINNSYINIPRIVNIRNSFPFIFVLGRHVSFKLENVYLYFTRGLYVKQVSTTYTQVTQLSKLCQTMAIKITKLLNQSSMQPL